MRLISYEKEIVNGEPILVSSNCLPIKAQRFEPAGHSFHSAALRLAGCFEEENVEDNNQDVPTDKEESNFYSSESYSSKSKKKSSAEAKQQDHYALLGLSHLRYLATEDQIRKSYREAALKHHPDKQAILLLAEETEAAKQAKKEEIENHFKAIQEAYEDFFKVFGPAFLRNGRWSVSQPVPLLGNDNTPYKEVDSFYDFWYSFKSWREFPHADEFDLEQAESRDHKRWMERQNAKLTEKARKEEYARIRMLVDNAYKRDPRIVRRKEEEKAEKQRKKEAKQKKLKEKEKKLLRKERTRLRTISAPLLSQNLLGLTNDDVEHLCTALNIDQLKNLCDGIEGREGIAKAELLREALGRDHNSKDEKLNEKKNTQQNGSLAANGQKSQNPFSSTERKEREWTKEEIDLLRKGVQKYPKGTSRRWEVISEYIGTGRTVEEILKATKTVLLQKPDSAKAFDSFLEKRKPAQTIASPLTTREEVEGTSNANKNENNTGTKVPNSQSSPSQSSSCQNPTDDLAANVAEGDVWSVVQERALVQALKTFPKEASQRWERVAAAVPGKTVNQCKKKFTLLKESFRNKKNAA
nr:DnaJ homolog subfamily C member 2-like [Ipomoea batatas]